MSKTPMTRMILFALIIVFTGGCVTVGTTTLKCSTTRKIQIEYDNSTALSVDVPNELELLVYKPRIGFFEVRAPQPMNRPMTAVLIVGTDYLRGRRAYSFAINIERPRLEERPLHATSGEIVDMLNANPTRPADAVRWSRLSLGTLDWAYLDASEEAGWQAREVFIRPFDSDFDTLDIAIHASYSIKKDDRTDSWLESRKRCTRLMVQSLRIAPQSP